MERKWINKQGDCLETEILSILKEQSMQNGCYYLAGYTNQYDSGIITEDCWLQENFKYLLELRIFCDMKEILFTRSRIGTKFQWRITDDQTLDKTEYIDFEQYIDINPEKSSVNVSKEKEGVVSLFTTVGGAYHLPLKDGENAAAIRAYISYDENGMAFVADHRLRGFVKK